MKRLHASLSKKKSIKPKDVEAWLSTQDPYTLHRRVRRKFRRRQTVVNGIRDQYQADLIDMSKHRQGNDGYGYILSIIDVFTKKAWAYPLQKKSGKEVSKAFDDLLKKEKCRVIQFDKGREFLNKDVKVVLKQHDVKYFTTENEDVKASIVERWNQTIQNKLYRWFTKTRSNRWIDVLDEFVKGYNTTPHSSTKLPPNQITIENEESVWNTSYHKPLNKAPTVLLKVGDQVRISKFRTTFNRGYTQNWSTEVFAIREVLSTDPVTYKLIKLEIT